MVARLNSNYQHLIPKAQAYGLEQRNIPYDELYLTDTTAPYCSEMIVDMFRYANGGNDFFPEIPMSFKDINTGVVFPSWVEYYAKFGMEVPDGEPCSNPGSLSKDSRLSVYEVIGPPTGYS